MIRCQYQGQPAIVSFQDGYQWLSNFYRSRIDFEGFIYPTAEHCYQAQKCLDPTEKEIIAKLGTPGEAKRWGRRVASLRFDWDTVRVDIMTEVVRQKFLQNADLALKLVETGNLVLVEGNNWGDVFWGISLNTALGENHLGKILMKIRQELQ